MHVTETSYIAESIFNGLVDDHLDLLGYLKFDTKLTKFDIVMIFGKQISDFLHFGVAGGVYRVLYDEADYNKSILSDLVLIFEVQIFKDYHGVDCFM